MFRRRSPVRVLAALTVGLATGLAAGLFIRSDAGRELAHDTKELAKQLKKKLMRKMKHTKEVSKEAYEDLVEEIIEHYHDSKEIAENELKQLRVYLLDQWDDLHTRLKEVQAEIGADDDTDEEDE